MELLPHTVNEHVKECQRCPVRLFGLITTSAITCNSPLNGMKIKLNLLVNLSHFGTDFILLINRKHIGDLS